MTHDNAYDTVKKYHRAWTSGDIDTAMSYVADDITCRAPGVDLDGKDAYRGFIGGFAPMLTGIGDIAEFVDEDRVALFYYPQTATTSTTPAAEFFTVKDAKIIESVSSSTGSPTARPSRPEPGADRDSRPDRPRRTRPSPDRRGTSGA